MEDREQQVTAGESGAHGHRSRQEGHAGTVELPGIIGYPTAGKDADETLRDSERRHRTLVATVPVGIFRTDAGGKCLYANRRACEIVGLALEQPPLDEWQARLHPDDRPRVLAEWDRTLREDAVFQSEHRFVRPDGTIVWVYAQALPERGDHGHIAGFVGTLTDITARKRAEEALRLSEVGYRHLVENASDIIFECDPAGYFKYVNGEVVRRILGYAEEEVIGLHCLALVRPDYRAEAEAVFRKQFDERISDTYIEFPALAKDGHEVWVGQHTQLVTDGDWVLRFQAICREITERKRAELELHHTSARLRALTAHLESVREEESRRLAAEVHDSLGAHLTMMKLGLGALLEKTEPGSPGHGKLESLLGLTEESIRITRRVTASLRPPMLDTLGLVATIRWYAGEFALNTGIRCTLKLPPYIRLAAERSTALFRIFQEALTNVARHSGASEVTILAGKSRTRVVLVIVDNGRGIERGDLDKRDSHGVLGMRERCQYLGGRLRIAGSPASGTRLTLRVPFENEAGERGRHPDHR